MNTHELLESLCHRFHGIDLQYRRGGSDWEKPWRLRLYATKNERAEYRLTTYGKTIEEAILSMQIEVNHLDTGDKGR